MDVPDEKLDAVLLGHTENFCDFLNRESVQKDSIHELNVRVLPKPLLQLRETVLVETFDEDDAAEGRFVGSVFVNT